MKYEDFNPFCRSLPQATHVVQWRGSDVWKVGGKVFAIARLDEGEEAWMTFKVSDIAFEALSQQPGLRPAPYFASCGMKWIQQYAKPGLSGDALKDHLRESHRLVSLGLSRKLQKELGLNQA